MKMRNYFFAAALVVLAASCIKENNPESSEKTTVNYVPMEFTSVVETKTVLAADGKVSWLPDDKISIFDNSTKAETHNNSFETTAGDGSFTGTVPEDASEFYALYPYREASSLTEGAININLPAEQNAVVGSFADDLAIMVAKAADGKLAFKNVCSHIKFTLADGLTDVKSITLMGNKAEILAGPATVDMSGTDPKITVSIDSGSQTYITLRNSDGTTLAAGDYYFTVLPVEFKEGFTVILSKTDGTQVAKKTTNSRNELASRNSILVMQPLAPSDYTEHMNYFVKYNDGFDLTFGGVTINKNTHPGGVLTSDNRTNSGNVAAKEEGGVYFIHPSSTLAKFNKAQAFKSLVVIGADASQRSNVEFYRQARPYEGGSLILLANIRSEVGDKNAFAQNTGTDGHSFTKFGKMVLYNCHFKNVGKTFMLFKYSAFSEFNLMVEDCEFGISAASVYMLSTESLNSAAQNVTFSNNVFYSADSNKLTDFRLFNGKALKVGNIVSQYGTYQKVAVPQDGLCYLASCEDVQFSYNIFVDCSNDAETKGNIMQLQNVENKEAVTGTLNNNFYTTSSSWNIQLGMAAADYKGASKATPQALSDSPLSDDWDPANEVYGAYKSVTYGDPAKPLPSTAGAQRPDMTAVPNSSSYRYPATDLGSF